ncbi:MAG: glycerol-3-phosphate dehydrogenase [Candidatus Promineifilaceae bacterium]
MNDLYDLLIIGGGINGAGIARDAAGRGLKVALVEQSDLGAATSSASTKLIHGGLRYLESYEFRLVRESLMERERLLNIAPHIVHPMEFVLPWVDGLRPRWLMKLGLFLYDHIGGRKRLPASRSIHVAGSPYGEGLSAAIRHGFVYSDCQVDDSRLVILNVLDAAERQALILPRTRFLQAAYEVDHWVANCEAVESRNAINIHARVIVNAAGPWAGAVSQRFGTTAPLRLVKGSHIVIPRLYSGQHALLLQNRDGRVVFCIPYQQHYTLVGTTDESFDGDPAQVTISSAETQYLCDAISRYFSQTVTPADVVWSYAGVRPLWDDAGRSNSKVTRDYRLELVNQPGPLLNIFGGKITTYRCLAESVLDKLRPILDIRGSAWTADACLPGGDIGPGDFTGFQKSLRVRWPFLTDDMAIRLAHTYGTRVELILHKARSMKELGVHFGEGLTESELTYLQRYEWASSVEDVLWRRTKLGLRQQNIDLNGLEKQLQRQVA